MSKILQNLKILKTAAMKKYRKPVFWRKMWKTDFYEYLINVELCLFWKMRIKNDLWIYISKNNGFIPVKKRKTGEIFQEFNSIFLKKRPNFQHEVRWVWQTKFEEILSDAVWQPTFAQHFLCRFWIFRSRFWRRRFPGYSKFFLLKT